MQDRTHFFCYRLQDPNAGLEYFNLRLIRAFEQGLDHTSSEAGFVLVHVDMVQHSGQLVDGVMTALDGCSVRGRCIFDTGLTKVVQGMFKVNEVMDSTLDLNIMASPWPHMARRLIVYQTCGPNRSPDTTTPFARSFLASLASQCFQMVCSTRVSPRRVWSQ